MPTAFAQLFWGFLLIILSFEINEFDILPDAIGYLLVVLAARTLAAHHPRFGTAYVIAIPLFALSVLDLAFAGVEFSGVASSRGFSGLAIAASLLVGLVVLVLQLVMVFNVCTAIAEMAVARGLHGLAEEARARWTLYLAMTIAGFVATAVAFGLYRSGGEGGAAALALLFFVFVLVVAVLFLKMLRRAQHEIPATPVTS